MKIKTILLIFLIFLGVMCSLSCKKDSSNSGTSSSSITVKYEVTWSAPLYQNVNDNYMDYTIPTGTFNEIDHNVSGTSWTKTLMVPHPGTITIVMFEAALELQQQGTCDVKIYANGTLEAENRSTGIFNGNVYVIDTNASWVIQ